MSRKYFNLHNHTLCQTSGHLPKAKWHRVHTMTFLLFQTKYSRRRLQTSGQIWSGVLRADPLVVSSEKKPQGGKVKMGLQGGWTIGSFQKQTQTKLQVRTASETSPHILFIMWGFMEMGGVVVKEIGENNVNLYHKVCKCPVLSRGCIAQFTSVVNKHHLLSNKMACVCWSLTSPK